MCPNVVEPGSLTNYVVHVNTRPTDLDPFPYKSEFAVVLGNGPSLEYNYSKIEEQYKTYDPMIFGVNRVFLLPETITFPIHYFTAMDRILWEMNSRDIHNRLRCMRHFAPESYAHQAQLSRLVPFQLHTDPHHFATEWGEPVGHGYTGIFACLQFAYIAGAEKIEIFGVDCALDTDGRSHFWGTTKRKRRVFDKIRYSVCLAVNQLEKLGVETIVNSHLFKSEKAEKAG